MIETMATDCRNCGESIEQAPKLFWRHTDDRSNGRIWCRRPLRKFEYFQPGDPQAQPLEETL